MNHYLTIGVLVSLLTAVPLAWKWQLGLFRVTTTVLVLATLSSGVVAVVDSRIAMSNGLRPVFVWAMTMAGAFALLAYRFYRDPERTPPSDGNAIVSPADGVVVYVRKSSGGMLPVSTKHGHHQPLIELTRTPLSSEEAVVIGIAMSFTDVHVNRAPIKGRITFHQHFAGRFGSLRQPEMAFENERATTIIEREDLQVAMVQIASRLVRQIAVFVSPGQAVALGQRIGVIRLGSQVDLVLPARKDLKITVQEGDRVTAGESVVAMLEAPVAIGDPVSNASLSLKS